MSEHITIETTDLGYSIDHITEGVVAATAAVGAMGHTLCEAEREAAEKVTASVNKGFFTLIRSQLMQKKVQAQSSAEAQLFTLRHFAQALIRIKTQLGVDYQRITSRYTKLFKTLNDSLKSRVYSLDRPAAEVADEAFEKSDRRVLSLGAPSMVVHQDTSLAASELAAVKFKRDCRGVIDGVKQLIEHGERLSRAMEDMLRDERQDELRSVYVPVVATVSADIFIEGDEQTNLVLPIDYLEDSVCSRISERFFASAQAFVWKDASAETRKRISDGVIRMLNNGDFDKRRKILVVSMLKASKLQALEAIG